MNTQFLTVRINRGCEHCEECGQFDYVKCALHFSDGFVQRGQFNDHLSSRGWTGELQDAYLAGLLRYGYNVKVRRNGVLQDPLNLTDTLMWLPDEFFAGHVPSEQLVLELDVTPAHSCVTLPAVGNAPAVVLNFAGTLGTDDWTSVYKTLLEQRGNLTLIEEVDPYFEPAPSDW